MIIYDWDLVQGSEEWLARRRGLWTGSAAIRLLQGKPLPREYQWQGNDATRRGHALEVAAIREYERRYGIAVQRPGFITNTVYPNAGYSPDGLAGGWLLECKALDRERHLSLITGSIPLEYLAQIMFGMVITGKRKARLLAFNPEIPDQDELTVMEVNYDKTVGANIRKKLRQDIAKKLTIDTPLR